MAAALQKRPNEKVLKAVRSNAGIEAAFRKRLLAMIDEMATSTEFWIKAAYRGAPPEMAQDELSSNALRDAIRKLVKRWNQKFEEGAERLADYFSKVTSKRSDAALRKILKDAGFTVEFRMTRAMRDVLNATITEQVGLIKSIPAQYLGQVQQLVMRGVQNGRDLHTIAKGLQDQLGVTKRRAAIIARDQTNKSTANFNRVRLLECGIDQAIWVHSGGGKVPRPTHVRAGRDKQMFDLKVGWFDPHEKKHIMPGELISCRCVCRPIVKGFS